MQNQTKIDRDEAGHALSHAHACEAESLTANSYAQCDAHDDVVLHRVSDGIKT